MTQPSRTTESISRDNAAIRKIMHEIRELTVPDRATLAVGLIGHLATMMNRAQMSKLMDQLREEAERVQDVPPARQREDQQEPAAEALPREEPTDSGRAESRPERSHGREQRPQPRAARRSGDGEDSARARVTEGVGQAGRGEFRSGKLL